MSSTNINTVGNSFIGAIAQSIGASEPAFKLLLTILAGFPLAAIYRIYIINKETTIHHLFFAINGIILCYFNYGYETYHSFIAILLTYIWVKIAYNSKYLIIVNFIFHMLYLLIGYYITESDTYDIKWTMPHCVLVLRLIGFVFDIDDGKKLKLNNDNNQSIDDKMKDTAIINIPTLLQLYGFVYFPGSFIVGPQYPYRRYEKFINKEFIKYKGFIKYGIQRSLIGVIYLCVRQIGSIYIPDDYLLSAEFKDFVLLKKLFILAIWGRITLYKYIACWVLTEGALICFGLTFVKVDENGEEDWSGCTNVKIDTFEKANKLGHYVHSFNVNTNNWLATYIYKRLKFLGNRMISQAASLLFLAVWHGFHSGYYICFALEFIVVTFERQFKLVYDKFTEKYKNIFETFYVQALISILLRVYTITLMGWCLIPFVYFNYNKWMEVFSSFYYIGNLLLGLWYLGRFIYKKIKKPSATERNKNEIKNNTNEDNSEKKTQ